MSQEDHQAQHSNEGEWHSDESSTPHVSPPAQGSASLRGTHLAFVRLVGGADADPAPTQAHENTRTAVAPGPEASLTAETVPIAAAPPADRPTPPGPATGTAPSEPPQAASSSPEKDPRPRDVPQPGQSASPSSVPSALGRLVALIVTIGLGWALAVAISIWLLVVLATRAID